jgi:hypothetical protein
LRGNRDLRAYKGQWKLKLDIRLKVLAVLAVLSMPAVARAEDAPPKAGYEARALDAFLRYCLTPLSKGDNVARVAQTAKLVEATADMTAFFLAGQPGKVFMLSEVGRGIILAAPDSPICKVVAKTLDQQELYKQVDLKFGPGQTSWKLAESKTLPTGEFYRNYTANIGGHPMMFVAGVRPRPEGGGAAQGFLTGIVADATATSAR